MKYLFTFLFIVLSNLILATTYYSDPVSGNMSNSGTFASPWANLEAIFNSGQTFNAGDVIFLRNGNHGFPKINGVNAGFVDIMAQSGHNPIINRIYLGNVSTTSFWRLSNLRIQTINVAVFPINLITTYPNTSNIVIQNCTIQSTHNTNGYSRDDWRTKSNNGIRSQGNNHIFQNNIIKNIGVGLSIESENTLVKNNEIQFFVTDGIRGLASYCTYEKNVIKDNIVVFTYAENHYDGFQAYTCCPVGTDTIKDVILRQNLIINTTDPNRMWRGPMQGMAGFDGYFENWTIENNVIITDHWHGITLLGAINCRIINNTVVDPYDVSPIDPYDIESTALHGPGWISIKAHKNGNPSYGNIIRNNYTAAPLNTDPGIGIIDHNLVIGSSANYTANFVDTANFNYRLINGSQAIDAGFSILAPLADFDDSIRPQGLGYDLGAFEFTALSYVNYTQNINICDGQSVVVGSSNYTTVGNYLDTLNTVNPNIDSIVITNLSVNPIITTTQNITICDGETVLVGSSTYTTSGNYTDVLTHPITGCDSIVITNLSVNPAFDLTLISMFDQASANMIGVNYQWVDCNNNFQIVSNSSSNLQTFVPSIYGSYAVVLSQNNCKDTSDCILIGPLSLNEFDADWVTIYPNPLIDKLHIESEITMEKTTIYSSVGKLVWTKNNLNTQKVIININDLKKGAYILEIETLNGLLRKNIIIL